MRTHGLLGWVVLGMVGAVHAREEILIADFEGETYGDWVVEGEAFGPGPARGTLPNQMRVSGYEGQGLVNSFHGGDRTTGRLLSPVFSVERRFLCFLVGGGQHAGETSMNLLLDGEIVRSVTGPNDRPGGTEALRWASWDVSALAGRSVRLEIVDRATGGWGHINIDHIVQSDEKIKSEADMELTIREPYLSLPVRTGAAKARMSLLVDGQVVRKSNVELSEDPEFRVYMDVRPFHGQAAVLSFDGLPRKSKAPALVEQVAEITGAAALYDEALRPQFHFSQRRGWNNDPNGMVYYKGEWHLFFQHNPYGWKWDNMHWGHAVSRDLVHWEELPIALFPWSQAVAHCFSGSAAMDWNNTAGFQDGDETVMVAAFTDTGCGEALAYSTDRGRTFTYYDGNPVVEHNGRDPKIFWYDPPDGGPGWWVMAVYDIAGESKAIAYYSSPDLKTWTQESRFDGFHECPELFPLPVDGDDGTIKWVTFGADARYYIGRFDGRTFTPDHTEKYRLHWGRYYASQLFTDAPDDRRIQIGWGQIAMEGMPFNQMMTFPMELSLRTTPDGVRLFGEPVREMETLRQTTHSRQTETLADGTPLDVPVQGDLFDVAADIAPRDAEACTIEIGGTAVTYDCRAQTLMGMPLAPVDGRVRIRILIDRPSIEVIGNGGRVIRTEAFRARGLIDRVRLSARGGTANLHAVQVHELRSTWHD